MASIRIIKETNDSIYNDIYWAHDGMKDGLKRIEAAIGDDKEQQTLLEAFRKIDTARENQRLPHHQSESAHHCLS